MFIYEKRLIDKATGQANDTLNITFEGNKPVKNPDVIINKDGVIGIKSDAYVENGTTIYTGTGTYSLENNGIGSLDWSYSLVNRYFTSISVNGEVIVTTENNTKSITLKECDYVGINIDSTSYNQINIIGAFSRDYSSFHTSEMGTFSTGVSNGGELIINMRTGEASFNGESKVLSDYGYYLNNGAIIFVTLS